MFIYFCRLWTLFWHNHLPEVALTYEERWEYLLHQTHEKVKRDRKDAENITVKRPIYQNALFNKLLNFENEMEWAKNHVSSAFSLPTSYSAPAQNQIEFEDTKVRIPIDVKKIDLIPTYSQEHLVDVVDGWIKYMETRMKALNEKVSFIYTHIRTTQVVHM